GGRGSGGGRRSGGGSGGRSWGRHSRQSVSDHRLGRQVYVAALLVRSDSDRRQMKELVVVDMGHNARKIVDPDPVAAGDVVVDDVAGDGERIVRPDHALLAVGDDRGVLVVGALENGVAL